MAPWWWSQDEIQGASIKINTSIMAKLFGISGKATGRKGDTVFAVRNGQQLIRQYNPMVANPSTSAQVDARAKLKLISQLSAILGKVIAIPREGAVSPRNLFTKVNYPILDINTNLASVDLVKVQLTKSAVGMEAISISRNGTSSINAACDNSVEGTFDHVVYVAVITDAGSRIRVIGSAMAEVNAGNPTAAATLPYSADAVVVLAYGIKDNDGKARAAFNNIAGDAAEHAANLLASRTLSAADATYSETKGNYLTAM